MKAWNVDGGHNEGLPILWKDCALNMKEEMLTLRYDTLFFLINNTGKGAAWEGSRVGQEFHGRAKPKSGTLRGWVYGPPPHTDAAGLEPKIC